MVLCPSIKSTCCPSYEQFKIFIKYNEEVKPHFVALKKLLKRQLEYLQEEVPKQIGPNSSIPVRIESVSNPQKQQEAQDIF